MTQNVYSFESDKIDPTYSAFEPEKQKLAEFITNCPGQFVIEIGAYKGATTVYLADECESAGKQLIAIDPWDNRQDGSDEDTFAEFTRRIRPYKDRVTVIRDDSQHAELPEDVSGNVCLVFIDGDHTYPHCRRDMEKFYPLLSTGSCLAVHDTFCPYWGAGIRKGLKEFIKQLPRPTEVFHYQYEPTEEEEAKYKHSASGISYLFRK